MPGTTQVADGQLADHTFWAETFNLPTRINQETIDVPNESGCPSMPRRL